MSEDTSKAIKTAILVALAAPITYALIGKAIYGIKSGDASYWLMLVMAVLFILFIAFVVYLILKKPVEPAKPTPEEELEMEKWLTAEGFETTPFTLKWTDGQDVMDVDLGGKAITIDLGPVGGVFKNYLYWDLGNGRLVLIDGGGLDYKFYPKI